jgi:hypothetical protein
LCFANPQGFSAKKTVFLQSIAINLIILTQSFVKNERTAVGLRGMDQADNGLCGMVFKRADARVIHRICG